jgi:DNA (cytosine-5)-methyltransferase 1
MITGNDSLNYYNEFDPYAAQWLKNLINARHIPEGVVDERSIRDVRPSDLNAFTQCHFFAGIGGWPYALRLAGWPDDQPVWTGSCPCQPFSAAGKRQGTGDERHLWPEFARLIAECAPAIVFGEQVAGKDGLAWIDAVRVDLEGMGYAVGAADLCAAGVGAPHIRQRLYWVADGQGDGRGQGRANERGRIPGDEPALERLRLADSGDVGVPAETIQWDDCDWLYCTDGKYRPVVASHVALADGLSAGLGRLRADEESPLSHGERDRAGRLRAYGNAIVPALAAEFIKSASNAIQIPF